MRAVIFAGPSLPPNARLAWGLDIDWRPPVRQGDLYRAALGRPAVIGVIDGYFEVTPTVWHKEILWAMTQGIHVFGAASIGALRAAELDVFGMKGIGRIYEDFRDGVLEDDDEVAVLHGPDELGYPPLTEAAQTRLTYIAGIRDDLSPAEYTAAPGDEIRDALLDALAREIAPIPFGAVPSFAADDLGEDLRWALGRLSATGIDRVIAVDLTRPDLMIPVVRLVIPGLEWDPHHPNYQPGPRAREVATR